LVKARKQLQEFQDQKIEKSLENIIWHLTSKVKVLEENKYQE